MGEANLKFAIKKAPQCKPERCHNNRRGSDMYSVLGITYRLVALRNQFAQALSDSFNIFTRQLGIFSNYIDRNSIP